MLAFEVSVNNTVICVAGVGDYGVLTACLTFVKRRSDSEFKPGSTELEFDVGGLVETEHLSWLKRELKAGDTVSVRIIETDTAGMPTTRKPVDPKREEKRERAYYERLKRKYEKQ